MFSSEKSWHANLLVGDTVKRFYVPVALERYLYLANSEKKEKKKKKKNRKKISCGFKLN